MTRPIVLVHGAWVTAESWDPFRRRYEARGREVHTPSWPLIEAKRAAEINRAVPEGFGSLTLGRIVDHLQVAIERLAEPPMLIGHSFGGLLVQLLLDRGVGAAAAVINPAPIAGVVPDAAAISAIAPILFRPAGWLRPYAFDRERFGRLYATGAPADLVDRVFSDWVIPAPGMIFHQAAFRAGSRVQPARRTQPLLITASDCDRLITPGVARAAFRRQSRAGAPTEFHQFAGRSHLLIAEPGWEEVADVALGWLDGVA
ncbi:MAG: alpha/beta fold hydrolase [Sphingomonas sp.]|uniref:alpha/beta hydrolase n=1 Tax=Sphingomonas sp. TaxID=28214 RepID=UPI001B15A131|nr:alpha/beta fold hydrolase [Sphingomonas sp.]MBO9623355.1 alpha/beta fold hydrolase [Sphingomonas sp.]